MPNSKALRALVERFENQVGIALNYAQDEKPRHEKLIASVFELQVGHLRDIAREAFAHLASSTDVEGWQTMDSAPRVVGELVLLYDSDVDHPEVASWSANHNCWLIGYSGTDPDGSEDVVQATVYCPTHWRPLPESPSPEKEGRT